MSWRATLLVSEPREVAKTLPALEMLLFRRFLFAW
jgi:hypothetical protein